MPGIEYKPNGLDMDQSVPKKDEKEKLSYIVSTTSVESPLKSIESVQIAEVEDIGERSLENPFLDPEVAQYWTGVYNESKYEGRLLFEPTLTWTAAEEKKVIRQLDWHVCLWAVSTQLNSLKMVCTNGTTHIVCRVLRRSA